MPEVLRSECLWQNAPVPSLPAAVRPDFERFVAAPSALRVAIADLDAGTLNRRPPGSDWSIRDILMHLVDFEIVTSTRLRTVIAAVDSTPVLPDMEQETWKRRLHYLWRDPEAALVTFQMLRFTNGELLEQCDAATFARAGTLDGHVMRLADVLASAATHCDEQIARIREFRGS